VICGSQLKKLTATEGEMCVITKELFLVLLIGTVLMCGMIALQMKWYQVAKWKGIVIAIALVFTGVYGSELWYFVENLSFGGRSLYGAIFCAPIVFFPVAKLLRIPYCEALDFCIPAGCLTLGLVKLQCLRDGCCQGIILYVDENHMYVRFPSQIVEFAVFLLLSAVLLMLGRNPKNRRLIFPQFLVLYGVVRFVLNFFRDGSPFMVFGLSAGSVWSLIAAIIGAVWLIVHKKKCTQNAA